MAKGKRRADWIAHPGGVSYPSKRRAKRVRRIAGGSTGSVERGVSRNWGLILFVVAALVAGALWVMGALG